MLANKVGLVSYTILYFEGGGGMAVKDAAYPRYSVVGWPVLLCAALNLCSVANKYPFAAGWTVSERLNYDQGFPSTHQSSAQQSSSLTTRQFALSNARNESNKTCQAKTPILPFARFEFP